MFNKETILQEYFTEKDIKGMTHAEFQVAMIGLIEKGLIEMEVMDGVKYYRPTQLLKMMKGHHNSNPKQQN